MSVAALAKSNPRDRWLVLVSAVGASCFAACLMVAAVLYPGGTWIDRRAAGHSLTKNFLCDLMQHRALNGQIAEIGPLFARAGTFAMLIALASFFIQVAKLDATSRAAKVARVGGLLACLLGCAVPLLPSDQFRTAHLIAVACAFLPSLVAVIAASAICLRTPRVNRWIKAAALVTLAAGAFDGLLYGFAYGTYALKIYPSRSVYLVINHLLPLLQRIATLGVLAWLVAVTLHTRATLAAESPRRA